MGVFLWACMGCGGAIHAEEFVPLWDFGFGPGMVVYPDYHGSDHYNILPVPVPYFIYRGKILKYDDDGLRGKLIKNDYFKFDFSGGVGPPARSKENKARKGMPSLDPAIELGLELDVHLINTGIHKLDLVAANRWVTTLSIHDNPQRRGRFATVPLQYQWIFGSAYNRYDKITFKAGPMFGSDAYHDYYYRVSKRYARDDRPEYNPTGGFGGMGYLLSYTHRIPTLWLTAFAKYEDLSQAVFSESPLVKTSNYWSCGIFIAYMIVSAPVPVEKES